MAAISERSSTPPDLVVVDCDVHVNEPPQALAPYCDLPWRISLEQLGHVPQRYLDIPGYSVSLALDPPLPARGRHNRTVTTVRQMRDDLDGMSIDIGLLFPDNLLRIAVFPDAAYAAALARAYNAWLAEQWLGREAGLYGAVLAAPQDPQDAAREIRRYGGHDGFKAVFLPCAGLRPLWGHRSYDPIYAAAEDLGLPVMLHSVGLVHPHFPFNVEQFDSQLVRHPIQHEFALMANLMTMVASGVPVRFPKLKIVFTEGGVAWVPYVSWRLDKEYAETRHTAPLLEKPPSHYIRDFYFCTQPIEEPERPQDLVTMIGLFDGAERVLFASDWPHHDFDHPREVLNAPFPPDLKRQIMGANALKLLGIPAPAKRS
ncbi:MAG: amidohydrolase [Actinobacteria bacterium]|nr:amidohydrolase [Actinomycetota bacterium]